MSAVACIAELEGSAEREEEMVEFRWIWHDMKKGAPPIGCIFIGDRMYQKLQFRNAVLCVDASGALCPSGAWTDWEDVKHTGLPSNT